ncbi:MAG TPA: APC family permease [Thermoanaerobaculia bacterium]|jgi:amino acid transporter|nr:APC family permease [Thermoanaerobaculia bacterium]
MQEDSGKLVTHDSGKLVRTVGFWGLVAMCINAVIGSGVFLLPYESYKLLGPLSLWAPLLYAIPVFILALNFAEAASHFTEPGGAYLYAKTAFGDFVGFETGWMNWIARVTSLASLSNGFVVALALLVPALKTGVWRAVVITGTILLLALIHFVGVKYGAASIYVFTLGKLVPLIGFILLSLIVWKSNPIPGSFAMPAELKLSEVSLFMLFAYAGFENLGVPAGEYKNPRRDLPMALLIGILIIAAIYVLVQLGAMSALPDLSKSDTPIASAAAEIIGPIGAIIVTIGALMSMAGTNSGTMLEGSRMLYALSLGRRMGPLSYVHPRFRTPSVAIAIHMTVALIAALAGSFRTMALVSAGARLVTYLMTCMAVPRLRRLNEGFRTPGLIVPILGVLVSLVFVYTMREEPKRALALIIGLVIGALLYFVSKPKGRRET